VKRGSPLSKKNKYQRLTREDMVSLFTERGSFEACALSLGTSTANFRKQWWEIVGSKPISTPLQEPVLQDSTFVLDLEYHHDDFYQVGVCSDIHFGSVSQQPTALEAFYDECRTRNIQDVFLAGDLVEGSGTFRGAPFKVFLTEKRAILDYIVANYPRNGIITHMIGGNHDQNFYRKNGFCACSCIAKKRYDIIFRGYRDATFLVGKNRLTVHHGAGSKSSIRDNRSNIMLLGHYHVFKIITEGNCNVIQLPAFHALAPIVGGIILTFKNDQSFSPIVELLEFPRIVDDY
jgi:predicted phosphodiesterase